MWRAESGKPFEMPRSAGEPNAIKDGERAITLVRQRAREWGVDPQRIGVLGFSSSAYLAADLAIGPQATRPSFVGLIYGGLRFPFPVDASLAFIAGAADDGYQPNDPILLYQAWCKAGVAAELHVYERGGHGFDLQPKGTTSDHWFEPYHVAVPLKKGDSLFSLNKKPNVLAGEGHPLFDRPRSLRNENDYRSFRPRI